MTILKIFHLSIWQKPLADKLILRMNYTGESIFPPPAYQELAPALTQSWLLTEETRRDSDSVKTITVDNSTVIVFIFVFILNFLSYNECRRFEMLLVGTASWMPEEVIASDDL